METDNAANADQIAYWNEAGGRTWAELHDELDRQIGGLGLTAIAALAPKPGERLADIGCGCGQTTLELAERVGAQGSVTGVDVSGPMLEIARGRAAVAGLPQAEFLEADAQIHAFPAGSYDGLFSRFGVMFFADPQAAFANLRRALKPGGRLTFISWRPLAENPWMTVPLFAALRHLPPPQPPPPGAPGPFAFADPEHVRAILAGAGFGDIALIPLDAKIGGNTIDEAVKLALRVGPLGAMLREYPEAAPRVVDDIRAALEPYAVDGRVTMDAAAWLASARNP